MTILRNLSLILCGLSMMMSTIHPRPLLLIDLSYTYDVDTPNYPLHVPFQSQHRRSVKVFNIEFQTAELYSSEHSGTHMDAPYHFTKSKQTIDELPLDMFEGPGVVINISNKAEVNNNPDASVTVEDIENWEKVHGLIKPESFVIMYSGWGAYAHNKTVFAGIQESNTSNHWPGFSQEACKFLVESRKVRVFGTDSLSLDIGISQDFGCHVIISEFGGIILENVANVDQLPPAGSYIKAYPMKIKGGSGAPTRIIATVPNPAAFPSLYKNFD